jgi:hypothetical protein
MITDSLINRLDHCLREKCPYIYSYYQDPLPDLEIDRYMQKMSIVSEDYKKLYQWKNGLDFQVSETFPKEFWIHFYGNFLSLKDAWIGWEENTDEEFWKRSQIEIMDNLIGEKLFFESDPSSDQYSFIYRFSPSIMPMSEPITIYDSLGSMLETIITIYENDGIKLGDDGLLETDFDLVSRISAAINVKSKDWKD